MCGVIPGQDGGHVGSPQERAAQLGEARGLGGAAGKVLGAGCVSAYLLGQVSRREALGRGPESLCWPLVRGWVAFRV